MPVYTIIRKNSEIEEEVFMSYSEFKAGLENKEWRQILKPIRQIGSHIDGLSRRPDWYNDRMKSMKKTYKNSKIQVK